MPRKKQRLRRQFTADFKAEIVELCLRGDRSVPDVVRDFDLTETAVRLWLAQSDESHQPKDLERDERVELAKLRRENRRLRVSAVEVIRVVAGPPVVRELPAAGARGCADQVIPAPLRRVEAVESLQARAACGRDPTPHGNLSRHSHNAAPGTPPQRSRHSRHHHPHLQCGRQPALHRPCRSHLPHHHRHRRCRRKRSPRSGGGWWSRLYSDWSTCRYAWQPPVRQRGSWGRHGWRGEPRHPRW
ncbi:transposase [Streptomyces sp. NRRL F-2664]|uniref:transposase n=1 Tax=Streptomyces sp. NRRL F-2664 TaxID=1463842 RepID=UPI003B63D542